MGQLVYGFYTGGDPRRFTPDPELCSERELADHREACRLYDAAEGGGETPTVEACESGWQTAADGTRYHVLESRYGFGVYDYGFD